MAASCTEMPLLTVNRRSLQVQGDVNNMSIPNAVRSSNLVSTGSWPASYANELGNAVITTPYSPSETNVAAQRLNDRLDPMRNSDYGHSSTHLNQDMSPSENCTPFTPMDITSRQEWYEDNGIGEMDLNKGDDGFDVQEEDWTDDFGGLLSSNVDFLSLADIHVKP